MVHFTLYVFYHDWKKEVSDHLAFSQLQMVVKTLAALLENSALFPLTLAHACCWPCSHFIPVFLPVVLSSPSWASSVAQILSKSWRTKWLEVKKKDEKGCLLWDKWKQVPFEVLARSWPCSLVVSKSNSVMVFKWKHRYKLWVILYSCLYLGQCCLDVGEDAGEYIKTWGSKLNNL